MQFLLATRLCDIRVRVRLPNPNPSHAPGGDGGATMHLPRLGLGLDFLTLALTAHQVAMEGPLEDVLQRLSLDASDFLQQLAKGTHEVS